MDFLSKYRDILNPFGDLKYIGAATPARVAEALVVKQLRDAPVAQPVRACGAEDFVKKICHRLGTTPDEMHACDMKFTASFHYMGGRENDRFHPRTTFIEAARDGMLAPGGLTKSIEEAQAAARHARVTGVMGYSFLVPISAGVLLGGLAGGFAPWQFLLMDAVGAGAFAAMLIGARGKRADTFNRMYHAATPYIVREWVRFAEEAGKPQIDIRDRWYWESRVDSHPLKRTLEACSKKVDIIRNIDFASPVAVRSMIDKAVIASQPDELRGFSVIVQSPSPVLQNIFLDIHVFPVRRDNDGDGSNSRRRRKNAGHPLWGWVPKPAPV